MNIHYFQHVPFEDLGSIEEWAKCRGHRLSVTQLYATPSLPALADLDWLIIMGGPMNVYEIERYPWLAQEKRMIEQAIKAEKVVLGICLGAQLIADVLGAKIYKNRHKEIGWFPIQLTPAGQQSPLLPGNPSELEVFHWHGDTFELPSGAIHLAQSAACVHQAFVYRERVIAFQFHLETTRRNAELLITHGKDELVDAPFIQTPEAMLSDEGRFQRINQVMEKILDYLMLLRGAERRSNLDLSPSLPTSPPSPSPIGEGDGGEVRGSEGGVLRFARNDKLLQVRLLRE